MSTQMVEKKRVTPSKIIGLSGWEKLGTAVFNVFIILLLMSYLFPILFMVATAFMETIQLRDRFAPPYPSIQLTHEYEGKEYKIYAVPFADGDRALALVAPGRTSSEFIDPQNPDEGLILWEGSWRQLGGVYKFHYTLENFKILFRSLRVTEMLSNTIILAIIREIGVLISSIIVAYGFARFPLPGGNFLFYLLSDGISD